MPFSNIFDRIGSELIGLKFVGWNPYIRYIKHKSHYSDLPKKKLQTEKEFS